MAAASILNSLQHVLCQGVAAVSESDSSIEIRKEYETKFEKSAADARFMSITILAMGIIIPLGAILISPASLPGAFVVFIVCLGASYFLDTFARYFDKVKEIFQDAGHFVNIRNQSSEKSMLNLFAEKATQDLPFFVRPIVELYISSLDTEEFVSELSI